MTQTTSREDAELVRDTRAGNRYAFAELVQRHTRLVYALAFSRVRNHAQAEDITQEAFLRAFQGLDRLREPGKFKAWLASIVRHVAFKHLKKRQREVRLLPGQGESTDDLRREIEARERKEALLAMMAQLKDEYCEVLSLHYFAGKSTAEIAEVLGVSRESVKKRLQRARGEFSAQMLETAFEPAERDEEDLKRRVVGAILLAPASWMPPPARPAAPKPARPLLTTLGSASFWAKAALVAGLIAALGGLTLWRVKDYVPALSGSNPPPGPTLFVTEDCGEPPVQPGSAP